MVLDQQSVLGDISLDENNSSNTSGTGKLTSLMKGKGLPREEGIMDEVASCHAELLEGLKQSPKQVPCSYLYDERGSALYNKITELEEYYPFKTELAMLHEHAADIITQIPPNSVLVELGCGSAEKTAVLQRALLARDGPEACTFVGIDVSGDFLEQAKQNLLTACPTMREERVELVQATYMDGVRTARERHPEETLCILWLGSSVGNLDPAETLQFFKDLLKIGGPKTEVLVCTDLWKDRETLHAAYCDSQGVTEAFILNGMKNAIAAASGGQVLIDLEKWEYKVIVNPDLHQVEMYVIAGEDLALAHGITIAKGERILMEISRKFLTKQLRGLAYHSGFYFQAQWANPKYSIQLFCTPHQAFTLAWRDTDALFQRLHDWNDCPIELRHPFLFYYGHVASFSKIRLVKGEGQTHQWDEMFSRGIDPDVSDPSQCHSHPEAPQQWPPRDKVILYTHQQREAVLEALEGGRCSAWAIHIALEHERLHQETLCYMLAQQQKQDWQAAHLQEDGGVLQNGAAFDESLARWNKDMKLFAKSSAGKQSYEEIPSGKVKLGVETDGSCGFVWDNEGPPKEPEAVEAFSVAALPVTIGEFRGFVVAKGYEKAEYWDPSHFGVVASTQAAPSTWTVTDEGDIWVHYPEGTWNWQQVKHRPVWCSLAEAMAYSRFKGARVMSETEYARALDSDPAGSKIRMLQCGGWEHTCTEFGAFPGFEPVDDYKEYSTDFFDGKHFVLKGASPYTHPAATRASFRNFYQDVYPHVFAKFRLCRGATGAM